jgi:hypothetical protein
MADAGGRYAAGRLAGLLAERGDLDRLLPWPTRATSPPPAGAWQPGDVRYWTSGALATRVCADVVAGFVA